LKRGCQPISAKRVTPNSLARIITKGRTLVICTQEDRFVRPVLRVSAECLTFKVISAGHSTSRTPYKADFGP